MSGKTIKKVRNFAILGTVVLFFLSAAFGYLALFGTTGNGIGTTIMLTLNWIGFSVSTVLTLTATIVLTIAAKKI